MMIKLSLIYIIMPAGTVLLSWLVLVCETAGRNGFFGAFG